MKFEAKLANKASYSYIVLKQAPLKPENLLAPYLHQHKKISLPGIGIFESDGSGNSEGISFIQTNVAEPDPEFINFIQAQTGKMKPLAMADLDSYLMLAKQFLNIGKAFYMEGIGTLQKLKDNTYQFTVEKTISNHIEELSLENKTEAKRKGVHDNLAIKENGDRTTSQKIVLVFILFLTVSLIGWGGYYLYKTNTGDQPIDSVANIITDTLQSGTGAIIQPDSSLLIPDSNLAKKDTITAAAPVPIITTNYRFTLERTNDKNQAFYRYNYVHKINSRIQLYTNRDSSQFKIFVVMHATPSDTSRIKDSLNTWYYGKKPLQVTIDRD